MDIMLTPVEARVIGALIEKEVTTPDQYPLSLNALTNACNQKSSRDPVMNLAESEVQEVVDQLVAKRLVTEQANPGNRVAKIRHRFCNTEFSQLHFNERQLAIICVLLLRGPQTPGELRTRTNRLASFRDVSQVESELRAMIEDAAEPYIVKLARESGKRESRYAQLFAGEVSAVCSQEDKEPLPVANSVERFQEMEEKIEILQKEVADLKALLRSMGAGESS